MNKERILENVDQYTADQLVNFIHQGIVTYDELMHDTNGKFTPSKRKEVKSKLEGSDDEEFNKVMQTRTIEACRGYLNNFPTGAHRQEVRSLLEDLEEAAANKGMVDAEEAAWQNAKNSRDIALLQAFANNYPNSKHVWEVNKLINEITLESVMDVGVDALVDQINDIMTKNITAEMKNNQIVDLIQRQLKNNNFSKAAFLGKLSEDHNLLSAGVVRRLINDATISIQDLLNININSEFIKRMMSQEGLANFPTPEKLDRIHKQSTEIYFWGIPSSGKSCALGAILSVANSGTVARSMHPDVASQGYGYMNRLITLFNSNRSGNLMTGTNITDFYEMGFDLVDEKGKIHPITCIDMAGELMRCMYKANAHEQMTEVDEEMLETLNNVLIDNKSTSRKMHFFVIEYGAESRYYEGLPQLTYLQGAVSYIQNTGLFKRETDSIYIMVTKADKAKNQTKAEFERYIETEYRGFYNALEHICKTNEINGGRVGKIAFSLGDVCFQNYCKFDPRPAENVVRIILERTASRRGGIFGKITRGLTE